MKILSALFLSLLFIVSSNTAFAVDKIAPEVALVKVNSGALLVDVRRPDEFSAGHLNGAINIPHDQVEGRIQEFGKDKSREIVLYCRSGHRAGIAQETLVKNGFTNSSNAGGFADLEPVFVKQR